MLRILLLLLLGTLLVSSGAQARTSQEVILGDHAGHKGAPQVVLGDKSLAIELCAATCDFFLARKLRSEVEVWDVVLLHQAYFVEGTSTKAFRDKYAGHVSAIMAAYASKCSKYPQDVTRATCIVKYLAGRNDISYAVVRYDGGNRCEFSGDLLGPSGRPGKGKCSAARK